MRTLVLLILLSLNVHAEEGKSFFNVIEFNKYKNRKMEILEYKNELVCKTEANPYFVLDEKIKRADLAKDLDSIKKLSITEKQAKFCHENGAVVVSLNAKTQFYCRDKIQDFLEKMSKICGRSL